MSVKTLNEANASEEVSANAQEDNTVNEVDSLNERLLRESKDYKAKWQAERKAKTELERKIQEQEKAKLAEQGQYKSLYEELQAKVRKRDEELKLERIRQAVYSEAQKAGCVDLEAAFLTGPHDLLLYDDENHQVEGTDAYMERLREKRPYLFQSKVQTKINNIAPSGGAAVSKPVSLAEAVKDPAAYRAMLAQAMKSKRG